MFACAIIIVLFIYLFFYLESKTMFVTRFLSSLTKNHRINAIVHSCNFCSYLFIALRQSGEC